MLSKLERLILLVVQERSLYRQICTPCNVVRTYILARRTRKLARLASGLSYGATYVIAIEILAYSWRYPQASDNFILAHHRKPTPLRERRNHPQLTAPVLTTHSAFKLAKEFFLPSMGEQLVMRGTLKGHSGWVTSLATSLEKLVKKKKKKKDCHAYLLKG